MIETCLPGGERMRTKGALESTGVAADRGGPSETDLLTILIVAEDATHAGGIRRAFLSCGLKVAIVPVATLREFREKAVQNPPDIAIVGLNLPDGGAVELMTRPPENGAFPILLLTSYENEQMAIEVKKSGAIDYVVASDNAFADMPRTVERALREWRLLAERKRAERDNRESDARFHALSNQFNALLDTLPEHIVIHGLDRRVIWANQATIRGLSANDVKSDQTLCDTPWHSQTTPCSPCLVGKSMQSGESASETVTAPDGKVWELRAIPVKEKGRITSVIEIGRDISEPRRLEEQLQQAQRMDAVGRVAGGVVHDFNNMLNAMMGYAELALKRVVSDEKTTSYLHGVLDAGQHSADLTRQLLAFSRKQAIEPRILDVNQTIANQIKIFGRLLGEDIDINFVPVRDAGPILMDPSQVDQILVNLMINARDAIDGPGTITLATANVDLGDAYCRSDSEARPGGYVRLTVSDTGSGMDAATLKRVFEPFFTTKVKGAGTGLGMATVSRIVKQNGGEIHATSAQGSGTTVVIHLPRLSDGQVATLPQSRGRIPRGDETILLVEDDEQSLKVTRLLLEEIGYTVIASTSPVQAFALYEQHAAGVAMLLSDFVMPQQNGCELYERISSFTPGLKALIMSGYTADVISQRGGIPEGAEFLHKPFNILMLAEKVRAVLDAA